MDRQRLVLAALLFVGVVGAALAAATLGSGDFSAPEPVDRPADGGQDVQSPEEQPLLPETVVDLVAGLLVGGMTLWAIALLALAVREGMLTHREAILLAVVFGGIILVGWTISETPASPLDDSEEPTGDAGEGQPGGAPTTPAAEPDDADTGPVGSVIALLAGLSMVGALAVWLYSKGGDGEAGQEPEPAAPEDVSAAVGRIAGQAAERLDRTDLSNAVYRAWRDMTDALDVADPETTTPAEFADRAVDAGVDEADARALTDLFRSVRYGGVEATPARETRARELLRRIQETYADEDRLEEDQ